MTSRAKPPNLFPKLVLVFRNLLLKWLLHISRDLAYGWILLDALEHHVLYVDRGGRCGGRGVVETRVWCGVSVLSPRFGEGLGGPEDVQIRRRAHVCAYECIPLRVTLV